MAERYTRLYTLPWNQYLEGSPVMIAAGALLKDNQTGRVLSQLKFRSITDDVITAIKIEVTGYDMSKEAVCVEEHQYLDLNVHRDDTWGAKEAITLPDKSVRSYSARVTAVYFKNGQCWLGGDGEWTSVTGQSELSTMLFDRELLIQYRLETTDRSRYICTRDRDLWLCACGEINRMGEDCHVCGMSPQQLRAVLNIDYLREKRNERLKAQIAEEDALEEVRTKKADRFKRIALIVAPILVLAILATAAGVYFSRLGRKYDSAMALYESGKYSEASSAFAQLKSYKDSEDMAQKALDSATVESGYARACNLLDSGNYDEAISAFSRLGEYKDSPRLLRQALTEKALSLIEADKEEEAAGILGELDGDAMERIKELYYTKAQGYLSAGDTDKAYYCYTMAGDYKDAGQQAEAFVSELKSEYRSYDESCEDELTVEYEYYSDGRKKRETRLYSAAGGVDVTGEYVWNDDGSYSVITDGTEYMFDDMGSFVGTDGEAVYATDYEFAGDGTIRASYTVLIEDEAFAEERLYDEKGSITQITDAEGNVTAVTNEYTDGRLSQQIWLGGDDASYVLSFQYNSDGQLIRRTKVTGDGKPVYTEYTYALIYAPDKR